MKDISRALAVMLAAPPNAAETSVVAVCEAVRARLLADDVLVGDAFESANGERRIPLATAAARASTPPAKALLLYRLARNVLPARLVELGSAFGVSGSYLASAVRDAGGGELVTIEASPSRAAVAARSIESVAAGRTTAVVGLFDENYERLNDARMVFIDGNHHVEPTLRYVTEACNRGAADLVLVLDDVDGYSAEMDAAWRQLARDRRFQATGRAGDIGLLIRGAVPFKQPGILARIQARLVR